MPKLPVFLTLLLFLTINGYTQSTLTATYTLADLPTSYNVYDPGCSNATLSVTLPAGGSYQVTNTSVEYAIQALGGGNRSEQRSQLVLQNTNTAEAAEASGTGGAGFQSYSRNTTVGNGIYPGGTTLNFLLRVKRTVEVTPGCNTSVQKVINSSWIITITYIPAYSNIPIYTNGCSMGDSISYFSLKGTGSSVIYNPSGSNCNTSPIGYSDYTTLFAPVNIVKGECFTGFMKTGSNDNYATIWIDANDNNQFEDNERILDNLQIGTVKKLYSIYIPSTMLTGIHRLRVRMIYTPLRAVHLTHANNSYSRGETEDYLVNISSTPSARQVAPGTPGAFLLSSETTISTSSNNNAIGTWVMLMDSINRYIVGIDAGGLNTYATKAKFYTHNGPPRMDYNSTYYLDRNIQVISQYQNLNYFNIRFFFLNAELTALISQPGSGVTSVFDINCTKTCRIPLSGNSYYQTEEDNFGSGISFSFGFGLLAGDRYIDVQVKGDNFFLHGGTIPLIQNPINVRNVVSTNVNKLNFANTVCDGISEAQTFIYYTNGVSIKAYAPDNFEIALQDGGYTSRVTLQPTTITGHTIYVRMKPSVVPDSADGEIIL
ncbi:MAG: hypothetical protein IPP48_06765 [Chitinophagaceae bacterium]|nr:hypothetical protein [Chitinophagaceae bacterium]